MGSALHLRARMDVEAALKRSRLNRENVTADAVALPEAPEYEFAWDGSRDYVALHDIVLDEGEMFVDGVRCEQPRDLRGLVTYTPAGASITGWSRQSARPNAFVSLCFDREMIAGDLGLPGSAAPAPLLHMAHAELAEVLNTIARVVRDPAVVDDIILDALTLKVATILMRPAGLGLAEEGLASAHVFSRVRDYLEANLHRSLSLAVLADVAGLSEFHFIRMFKRAFGVSPYKYLLQRRIARAKAMIDSGAPDLTTVWKATGFAGASQFSRTFQQIAGESPREYRARQSYGPGGSSSSRIRAAAPSRSSY